MRWSMDASAQMFTMVKLSLTMLELDGEVAQIPTAKYDCFELPST